MSCGALSAAAHRPGGLDLLEGPRREVVVAHLRGCVDCRRRALEIDPTFAFSFLEAPEIDGEEVDEIRRTVRAMRRVRELAGKAEGPRHRAKMTTAALLLLAAALLLLPGEAGRRLDRSSPAGESVDPQALLTAAAWRLASSPFDPPTASLIEDLDRPQARVYQLTEDDLSLVMIVDETLDL